MNLFSNSAARRSTGTAPMNGSVSRDDDRGCCSMALRRRWYAPAGVAPTWWSAASMSRD